MTDVSNKALAILIGVAIIISAAGIFVAQRGVVTLTGMAQGTGVANLTIQSLASISVSNNIEFGSGQVSIASSYADLWSDNGTASGGNWSFSAQAITIENDGNKNVSLTVIGSAAASTIGGTSPALEYWVQEDEANSCDIAIGNGSTYQALSTSAELVCDNLLTTDASDLLKLSVHARVPQDAPPGIKTTTITFTGTAI